MADLDECDGISHGCEQYCINTIGSYTCTCDGAFEIDPHDWKRCKGNLSFCYCAECP